MFTRLRKAGRLSNHRGGMLDRIAAKIRLPLDRWYNERVVPDVARLHAAVTRQPDPEGPHVMVATLRVWHNHAVTEALVAAALRERGAKVSMVTCGGGLPVCEIGWARRSYPRPCDRCAHFTDRVAGVADIPHYRLADYFPWGENAKRAPLTADDIAREPTLDYEHAGSQTAAWFMKATSPERAPEGPEVVRDAAATAAAVELAIEQIFDEAKPDIVLLANAILVEENVIATVARRRGIRAVTYGYGIHENTLVLSAEESPALDFKNAALWDEVRDTPLTAEEEGLLDRYLAEREGGAGTADYFATTDRDPAAVRRELGIPEGRPLISLFSNITWDSACLNKDIAFRHADDWIATAVRAAAANPDRDLVVRVHPAEAWLGTYEPAAAAAERAMGELPPNVFVVGPERELNSYALVDASDLVLVYTSTTGLEAAVRGKRVATAGDTHYRGKGFTVDLETPADLVSLIGSRFCDLSPEEIVRARRYAYGYFFRLMTPIPSIVAQDGPRFSRVSTSRSFSLAQGSDPYLDLICDRILDGRPLYTPRDLVQYPRPFPPLQPADLI